VVCVILCFFLFDCRVCVCEWRLFVILLFVWCFVVFMCVRVCICVVVCVCVWLVFVSVCVYGVFRFVFRCMCVVFACVVFVCLWLCEIVCLCGVLVSILAS